MNLSDRIKSIEGSKTVAITGLIQQLTREGKEILDLAVGEVGFDTPKAVVDATKNALDELRTRYGPVAGLADLRLELAKFFESWGPENILVSNGAKQALYMIFQCLCNPGDEVIIPLPYWVSFSEQVKLAGAVPVMVPTRNHQLDIDAIAEAVTARTKIILINSPNNPSGAVYPLHAIEQVARLAVEHDLMVISDEAYDEFVYDDLPRASIYDIKNVRDRCIITRSFSKSFSMTGFRVGYVAAGRELIKALAALQSHLSGNVCTFAQYGALAALVPDNRLKADWQAEMQLKRDIAFHHLSPLLDCVKPQGAFYLFADVSNWLGENESAVQLAERILLEANVAVVPGEAFGVANHVRISFGVSPEILKKGLDRLLKVFRR